MHECELLFSVESVVAACPVVRVSSGLSEGSPGQSPWLTPFITPFKQGIHPE